MAHIGQDRHVDVDNGDRAVEPCWIPRDHTSSDVPLQPSGSTVLATEKGRQLAGEIEAMIDSAREVVVAISFLISDKGIIDALLRAAGRGVRVYLATSTEARLAEEAKAGRDFDERTIEEHKQMLRAMQGKVLIRSASHFHAKAVLADPFGSAPRGYLLTANLNKEALERNEELGVRLEPAAVREVFQLLRWALWEAAEHDNMEPDRMRSVRSAGILDAPPARHSRIVHTAGKPGSLRDECLRLIRGAQLRLVVACYGWDKDHEVVQALCQRAREGVEVSALVRWRTSREAWEAHEALAAAGVTVLGFEYLHAKAIWSDRGEGLVGSANFEPHGLDDGFELGVRLSLSEAGQLRQILGAWSGKAERRFSTMAWLRDLPGNVWLRNGKELMEQAIVPQATHGLGEITVPSAELLEDAAPSQDQLQRLLDRHAFARSVRFTWQPVPPSLGKGAKPRKEQDDEKAMARIYEDRGKTVIAIKAVGALSAAKQLKGTLGPETAIVLDDRS